MPSVKHDRTGEAARVALARALSNTRPDLSLTAAGYVERWSDNVVPECDSVWFKADLDQGAGRELDGKFRAAYSSSALAVNTFARFKPDARSLTLAGLCGFDLLRFEVKCPAIPGRKPPHLDLVLQGNSTVVGVESKCTEHFSKHTAKFALSYDELIQGDRRDSAWFRLMHMLIKEPKRYCYLNAAQLVKHAFGLAQCYAAQDVSLVYLYWEPRNADQIPVLLEHRSEIVRFTNDLAGGSPKFVAMSYRTLWDAWEGVRSPAWLPDHLAALRARYDIVI